jgi:4-amino-4-deoxy-L-arabinose transferase-like glycosyltransferase
LVAIMFVALALRTVPAPHWETGDAENYSAVAWRMSQGERVVGTYAGPPHKPDESMGPRAFAIRPGVTFPASIAFRVLPAGAWAAAAFPLVIGLSEVLLAFLLGRRFGGNAAGLIAALMVATIPQSVVAGRALMADMPAAVLAAWAILAFVTGAAACTTFRSAAFGAAAGVLLGCSWLSKETLLLMTPALAAVAMAAPASEPSRRWTTVMAAAAGLMAVVACESMAYAHLTGDWMFRVHELSRNFEQCRENFWYQASASANASALGIGGSLTERLVVAGPTAILLCRPSMGICLCALVAAACARWRGRPLAAVPLCWLAGLALAFNFGSTSLSAYRPLPPFSNYLYPLVLPGALVIAGVLAAELEATNAAATADVRRRAWLLAAVASMGLAYAAAAVAVNRRNSQASDDILQAARALPESACVATDFSSRLTLSLFMTGTPDIGPCVVSYEDCKDLGTADYLVVIPDRLRSLGDRYGYEPPGELRVLDQWDTFVEAPTLSVFVRRRSDGILALSGH